MKKYFASSELIINEDGSVFHLHVKPEWLADKVILVGDPGRVALVASHFENKECEVESREFKTITGTYQGKRITVVSTGIGCDNIDIVMNELDALANIDFETREEKPRLRSLELVRIGTCGGLQPYTPVGTFVCSEKSIGFDGLLNFYAGRNSVCDLPMEENKLFEQEAEHSRHNRYIDGPDKSMGIIACGLAYNYIMENFPEGCPFPVLKISQYPLPTALVQRMASECRSLLIVEEGQPLVEEMIRGLLGTPIPVKGRLSGELPRTGELTPDNVRGALGLPRRESEAASQLTMPRPPALCQGCGHRDVYTALNDVLREHYPDHKVFSDIGCYTLGSLPPFRAIDTCVEMGASVTMAKGAADGGQFPSVAVIGDSTFTHSGMTALLDAVNEKSNITVCIRTTLELS
jgi:uridine phosphorylase